MGLSATAVGTFISANAGTIAAIGAVAGAGVSYMNGQKQASAMKSAEAQAEANAQTTATQQEQAINKANAKAPDTASIISANQMSAKGGGGGTMLTGPAGVDPNSLALGKNTLLGS
jgi:hypothetical protein